MSVTINVDTAALDRLLDGMSESIGEAVRPAAQAAAQVIYDEVKKNVASIGRVSGNLDRAIYQAYSKDHSINGVKAEYHVSWNARKAPHGHLIEYGHIQRFKVYIGKDGKWYTNKKLPLASPVQVGARPFIRPAMAKFDIAVEAAEKQLVASIQVQK